MKYKHICVICEWNLLFWRLDLAYFREKRDLSFDDLAGPGKKMTIPQHGPQNKLTKLYNYGHKISKRFTQADSPSIKLAIFASFSAFSRPRSSQLLWYPLLICTSDPRLLPNTIGRHTRRSGSRDVGGKQQSLKRPGKPRQVYCAC